MEHQFIAVLVTRNLLLSGTHFQAGELLQVEPLVASQLIGSGRARLKSLEDLALLIDAEKKHTARVCRIEGPRGTLQQTR